MEGITQDEHHDENPSTSTSTSTSSTMNDILLPETPAHPSQTPENPSYSTSTPYPAAMPGANWLASQPVTPQTPPSPSHAQTRPYPYLPNVYAWPAYYLQPSFETPTPPERAFESDGEQREKEKSTTNKRAWRT